MILIVRRNYGGAGTIVPNKFIYHTDFVGYRVVQKFGVVPSFGKVRLIQGR